MIIKNTPPATTKRRKVPPILLSDPGRHQPVAIIDSREQTPLVLPGLQTVTEGLTTGDYSIRGAEHLFTVERKSLDDLVACVTRERERFERELIRIRGYRFRRILIIGTVQDILDGKYTSAATPGSVLGSLAVWEARYDVPVVHVEDAEAGGETVANWIRTFARELVLDAGNVLARETDLDQ